MLPMLRWCISINCRKLPMIPWQNAKNTCQQAMAIIDEVKDEFITWTQARKFAPTIHALKAKLEEIKENRTKIPQKENTKL